MGLGLGLGLGLGSAEPQVDLVQLGLLVAAEAAPVARDARLVVQPVPLPGVHLCGAAAILEAPDVDQWVAAAFTAQLRASLLARDVLLELPPLGLRGGLRA